MCVAGWLAGSLLDPQHHAHKGVPLKQMLNICYVFKIFPSRELK